MSGGLKWVLRRSEAFFLMNSYLPEGKCEFVLIENKYLESA